ncbi:lysophospholipid acyltransferase family protein [bacterium]|nr:lysophospholipid acyltransferase family protein [bacterium]MBU1152862.1 lysophospholipid acyltransferase family protein [bacterium]
MIKSWTEYFLFLVAINIIKICPLSISYFLGRLIGQLAYFFLPKYRKKAIENLSLAFSDYSKKKIKLIAYRAFQNFGKSLIEFFRLAKTDKENIQRQVTVEGLSYLKEALESKNGVIIFSAHLGNWELISLTLALAGYSMNVVVKRQSNKYIDGMINKIRKTKGVEVLISQTPKKIGNLLQKGKIIVIAGDQSTSKKGVKVKFFHKFITIPRGAAFLALRYKASLLPTFDIREENNQHRIIINPPIAVNQKAISLEEVISCLMKKVEEYIKLYPDQWIWWYRQWEKEKIDNFN